MKVLRRFAYALLLGAAFVWGMKPAPEARAPAPSDVEGPEPPSAAAVSHDAPAAVVGLVVRRESPPDSTPDTPVAIEPVHTARVADSIGPLRDALRPAQQPAVEAAVERKTAAIAALQSEALADGADPADISARARRVQDEFEAELAAVLDGDQMQAYYELKQQGGIGTYAIVMPGRALQPMLQGGRARRP